MNSNVKSLMYLATKREVSLEVPNENGEAVLFKGVVTANVLDLIQENAKQQQTMTMQKALNIPQIINELQSRDDIDIKNLSENEILALAGKSMLSEAVDFTEATRVTTANIKSVVKAFLGSEQYKEYEKTVEHIGVAIFNKNVYEMIIIEAESIQKDRAKEDTKN